MILSASPEKSPPHGGGDPSSSSLEGLRVAVYAGMFVENFDGATKTLFELLRSLHSRRVDIGVWTFSSRPASPPGIPVFRVAAVALPFYPDYKFALPSPGLFRRIRDFRPDLIHLTVPDAVGVGLAVAARILRIPLVMSYHTDFLSYLEERNLWYLIKPWKPILRWYYNRADSLLVPSRDSGDKLSRLGIQQARVWGRGLPEGRFDPSFRSESLRGSWGAEGRKVILYSGQFAWFKGLLIFTRVYDLFQEAGEPPPLFVLLGRGPLEEELRRRMPDAVFPGYLTGKALSSAYASADLLLFTSTTETFGNAVQESIASGVPAVVSDEGGCREIVEWTGGGLVARARSARSFFDQCRRLLEDEALYRQARSSGLAALRGRDWETVNSVVLDEYRRLASPRST